jgi:hypothetical protein
MTKCMGRLFPPNFKMSHPAIPKNVDNLTTSAPSSDMSKAEADKTVVKGIAHKYEGAVKVGSIAVGVGCGLVSQSAYSVYWILNLI